MFKREIGKGTEETFAEELPNQLIMESCPKGLRNKLKLNL
jgi:hypothetical protein